MPGRLITLQYPAKCKECDSDLNEGDEAYYYGRAGVYGLNCHERETRREGRVSKAINSRWTDVDIHPRFVLSPTSKTDPAISFDQPSSGKIIIKFNPTNEYASHILTQDESVIRHYINSLYVDAVTTIMINKRPGNLGAESFMRIREQLMSSIAKLDVSGELEEFVQNLL